jgi:lysine/ornithine N-monooxygenase
MSTEKGEWEQRTKAELAVFWDEIAKALPKSMERSALGDEKIFRAFASSYPKMREHLLTAERDRLVKEVEGLSKGMKEEINIADLYKLGHAQALEDVINLIKVENGML